MIRSIATITFRTLKSSNVFRIYRPFHNISKYSIASFSFNNKIAFSFADYPKHQVLSMPALSPTMTQGKVVKWLKKVGDAVSPGDVIADIQTDKATVGFEVQQKGYIAKINTGSDMVKVGTPVVILTRKADSVKSFEGYNFSEGGSSQPPKQSPKVEAKSQPIKPSASTSSSASAPGKQYPKHTKLQMPALSPTMTQGKITKWNVQVGQSFGPGDSLCSIETDKATVDFEAQQKGVLAKILVQAGQLLPVGKLLAVSVKRKQDIPKFTDYTGAESAASTSSSSTKSQPQAQQSSSSSVRSSSQSSGDRTVASPAAKMVANQKGISIQNLKGLGSGPGGRILRQDVQSYQPQQKKLPVPQQTSQTSVSTPSSTSKKVIIPNNPFQEITLSGMRKTIASRLLQSKTTIPHYYINLSMAMDSVNDMRNQLNKNEKQNGVKISINDIIIKAMALALRDYPMVNAQWNTNSIKKFKHADIGVAVATEGGLITPIVFRAQTLGFLDIAKRTKDIAKRARQGKLDPFQYIGGTSTISNIGMYGIDSVTSVINPPQSTILGVGQTQKKIIFNAASTDADKPYKVSQQCQMIVSADHRVVDGALAAQWIKRIQFYLQDPMNMLL